MIYLGQVKDGVVVLDDGIALTEGLRVRVEPAEEAPSAPSLVQQLQAWAGKGEDLPKDLARNHDHYLHGSRPHTC